jgi:CheY-like chemotaxis protein
MAGADAGRVVLVVDDDPEVRETVVQILEEQGFTVIDAANGRQALDILESDPTVNVLFTDVMMPGISGITLARKAMELRPGLRIVLTSAYLRDDSPGEMTLVRKPYMTEELLAALRA